MNIFEAITTPSLEFCYQMGRDCARNGANEENCHFRLFCDKAHTEAWERGKREATA